PGSRAPHYELVTDGRTVSTLDLFGRNFVLLAGADAQAWRESGEAAAREVGIGLDLYTVDAAMDPNGNFAESYGITPTGAVLVRPDGFVAWRATTDGEAELHSLSAVLGSLLGQSVADQLQA
ncbi:MAG TPA: monooxygenase, partial [Terrimesophilobacter sp.]|nr:monooxygenase [Terrimesophilobacter sp.]